MKKVRYRLYTRDLFSNETDTKVIQPWIYRGIYERDAWGRPYDATTATIHIGVQLKQLHRET